jgi:hypothetical protein
MFTENSPRAVRLDSVLQDAYMRHMRRPPPLPRRGVPKLSDHRDGKIAVACEKCGMMRRYDANEMFKSIGDRPMPMLLIDIAIAEGCPRAGSKSDDRCMLHYDLAFASMFSRK